MHDCICEFSLGFGHGHSAECPSARLGPTIPVASTVVWFRGQVLLGLRTGHDAAGTWNCPGGKADQAGSMADTAAREVYEETGERREAWQFKPLDLWDSYRAEDGQMFVCVYFELETSFFQPRVTEPEKMLEWRWFRPDRLPEKMFDGERRAVTLSYYARQPRTNH